MRKRDIRSETARQKLLAAMKKGQKFSWWDACDFLFLTRNNNNKRHLKALHADRMVHINHWRHNRATRPVPVFAIGAKPDAPRPDLVPRQQINAESQRRYREKVGVTAIRAIRRAYKAGASALVVQGVTVWRKYQGINIQAAKAAFSNSI